MIFPNQNQGLFEHAAFLLVTIVAAIFIIVSIQSLHHLMGMKDNLTTVLQLILIAIYRLTFHPLARYPGPFLAKITDWHQVYHAWKGDRHLEFWRTHEKYGLSCLSTHSNI